MFRPTSGVHGRHGYHVTVLRRACTSRSKYMWRDPKRPRTVCQAEIKDKSVLIVGASRGIGLEVGIAD